MKNIIAIDPSISSCGVCYNGAFFSIKTTSEDSRYKRIHKIVTELNDFMSKNVIHFAAIEQYALYMRNTSTLTGLAELGGVLKYELYKKGINPFVIPAKRWKAMLFNQSSAKKNLILKEVYKKYGKDCKNSDEADAFSIYKCMELIIDYLESPEKINYKYHEKIMHTIVWDIIRKTKVLDEVKIKDSKDRPKTEYYFKNKKVSSFKGLVRYMKEKEVYKIVYDQFCKMYKVGGCNDSEK